MFCVSFLSNLLSALCAYFGLVLSHALGYVAAPLAKPEREYLADQLVRERDEVVQRGVRRADLAAIRETAEGQDLQSRRHDVRAPGTVRVDAVYLGFDRDEVGIGKEVGAPAVFVVSCHTCPNSRKPHIPHTLPPSQFPFTSSIYGGTSTQEHGHNFRKHRSSRTTLLIQLLDDHRDRKAVPPSFEINVSPGAQK